MAVIEVNFFSNSLKRMVPFQMILPVGKRYSKPGDTDGPFKTIYLLHGLRGNYKDWVVYTEIQYLAEKSNLAVVMPSGENSCYVEQLIPDNDFGEYVGHELVEITRKMFPLSDKREDTFIGGLSMGGFGALRNGFKYAENFSKIVALSAALHFFESPLEKPIENIYHEERVFGDRGIALLSDKNPRVAFENLRKNDIGIPEIYMACGLQDSLLWANQSFKDFLVENGAKVNYEETEGEHNWTFWNSQIPQFIKWLF